MPTVCNNNDDDLNNSNSKVAEIKRIPHPKKVKKGEEKLILNYRLEEVCGYGAWGKVKRGWDLNFDRQVAIKILRKKRITRKIRDGINKIYKEYDMLKGLDHECIVKYYDLIETNYEVKEGKDDEHALITEPSPSTITTASTTTSQAASSPTSSLSSYSSTGFKDGKIYLVMEWLGEGCNLSHWIASTRETRNIDSIRCILKKLMEAVEYLRQVEIAHHDIKLDNVIFHESKGTVKLIDFGVSECCPRDESFCAFGTPAYQAPEILTRSDPCKPVSGHKSDMWSLGVVAYQLANPEGKLPFEGESVMEVFDGIIHDKPDFSIIKNDKLRDLIKKLLRKNPKNRLTASEALKHPFITGETGSWYLNNICKVFKSIFTL